MPTKESRKQPECKGCGHKLKRVPMKEPSRTSRPRGNGWAHKKKEHWTPHPHKAVPVIA